MINIIGIKCKGKIFVSEFRPDEYRKYSSLKNLIINGKSPEETFHLNWCIIDSKPITVQKYVKQPNINHRFELFDPTAKSDKIKLTLKREDILEEINGELDWKSEYETYRSLYKTVSDKQPDILEDVEFKYKTIAGCGFHYV
jgi:hypothetical protein